MTANRWWVRLFARWKAKITAVQPDINLFFNMVRTVAIVSGIMTFFSWPAWSIVLLMGGMIAGVLLYAHIYSEGGVWNQTMRDKRDYSNNFAGPNGRIVQEIGARSFLAGMLGRELTDEEREAIAAEADASFEELRDGVPLDFDGED